MKYYLSMQHFFAQFLLKICGSERVIHYGEKMLSENIRYSWLLLGTFQRSRHINLICLCMVFIAVSGF